MSDWQPGDLALCIAAPLGQHRGDPNPCRKGRIYTVEAVVYCPIDGVGLSLVGITFPCGSLNAASARHYRKVTPPKADQFDIEVIEIMTFGPREREPTDA